MKDCHQTVKLLSVTKILFRQKQINAHYDFFARRYNLDIWKIFTQTINTPLGWQEDFSRGSYKRIVREGYLKFKYSHPLKLKTFWPSECSTLTDCNWNLTSQALAIRSSLETSALETLHGCQFKFSTDFIKPNYLIILFWSVFLFVSTHCPNFAFSLLTFPDL